MQSSYGFIHYFDRRSAAMAILSLNVGICKYRTVFFFHFPCLYFCFLSQYVLCRFGQPIKVNWAYASGQREDTSGVGSVLNQ